jgi:hypothetical protein
LQPVSHFGFISHESISVTVRENGYQTRSKFIYVFYAVTSSSDFRWTKEILCSVLAGLLGTPGGILLFLPIYHPLHDIFKIHSEVTYFILLVTFLLIIWSADRTPKKSDNVKSDQHSVHWSTWLLVLYLLIHYVIFLIIPVFFNPEDEVAIGLKEPIGPCNEYTPIKTAFGMVSNNFLFCKELLNCKHFLDFTKKKIFMCNRL